MDTVLENAIKVRLFDNYLEKVQVVDPFEEVSATLDQSELPGMVEMYRRFGDEGLRALIHAKAGVDNPGTISADYARAREYLGS
jgi:hypothetical protein